MDPHSSGYHYTTTPPCTIQSQKLKQAEAEVVPSSSLVEVGVDVEVGVEIEVEVGIEVRG